jgi:hypothetical protein
MNTLDHKIQQKISAMKAEKTNDPNYNSEEENSEGFEYGNIGRKDSIKSEELDEIIRDTERQIEEGNTYSIG